MSKAKKPVSGGNKTLYITLADGTEVRTDIPVEAKITFGPSFPQATKGDDWGGRRKMEYALRVYEGSKDNMIAVFTGVREFRESRITLEKKIVSEAGKTVWRSDESGYRVETEVSRKEKFKDLTLLETDLKEDVEPD